MLVIGFDHESLHRDMLFASEALSFSFVGNALSGSAVAPCHILSFAGSGALCELYSRVKDDPVPGLCSSASSDSEGVDSE